MPEPKPYRASRPVLQRAIQLRQEQTSAEALLWTKLRGGKLGGFKFRRQHPIDRFIVDFYCPACRLVVELDGPIHDSQTDHDCERTAILNQSNRQVIRFSNNDVLTDLDSVLESILSHCLRLSSETQNEGDDS